jgi:hypothetical protein
MFEDFVSFVLIQAQHRIKNFAAETVIYNKYTFNAGNICNITRDLNVTYAKVEMNQKKEQM